MLQKYFPQLATVYFVFGTLITKARAQLEVPPVPDLVEGDDANPENTIVDIITLILDVILIIAVLFVVIAGVRLIISSGNEDQKEAAKKTIIYVVVGIIVILLARAIVVFVANTVQKVDNA